MNPTTRLLLAAPLGLLAGLYLGDALISIAAANSGHAHSQSAADPLR